MLNCKYCGASFTTRGIGWHIKARHMWNCRRCKPSPSFASRIKLIEHEKQTHGPVTVLQFCAICEDTIHDNEAEHYRSHHSVRTYFDQ